MSKIRRKRLLQLTGAAAAAGTGGIASIVASGQAPAFAQGVTLHWLRWNDFIPNSDVVLRQQIVPMAQKALGISLNIEMINGNDLQARSTAAIQSGTGPDIILALNNWAHLYQDSLTDVSDIAEQVGKSQKGFYPAAKAVASNGKRWMALPWCILGNLIAYRKSWFDDVGATKFPTTWEEYRRVGKLLKAKGRPVGQALGHSFGDPPTFIYPYLWSWGGKEIDEHGKVVLNSKATSDALSFWLGFWKDAHDEGGLAWDDSSNNRAYLSGTISATLNGASIYLEAKRKPDQYKTEKGAPLWQDTLHAPLPRGTAGQFAYHLPMSNMLMKYSKNQKAAKEFLAWVMSPDVYRIWFDSQQGYSVGTTWMWEADPLWSRDPVMLPFRQAPRYGRFPGYQGPADRKAAEVLSKYIIIDMFAKAVQGMPVADAVKWAQSEVSKIHYA
jgi:multiple sugar transport system substrate-binding protein